MKKAGNHIALLLMILFQQLVCTGQALNVGSLQKTLPRLKDSARVDCMNALSNGYLDLEQKHTAIFFANKALQEALQLHYNYGVAISFCRKAQIAKHFDDDFIRSEAWCRQSLQWFARAPDKTEIETVYRQLIYALLAQSRFAEGLEFARKLYATAKQKNDQAGIRDALVWMGALYRTTGDYATSFRFAQQVFSLSLQAKNKWWINDALYSIAQLYMLIEDYPQALSYFRQVFQVNDPEIEKQRVINDVDIWLKMEFTEVFSHMGRFDSAWYYYRRFKPAKPVYLRVYWVSTGECFYLQKKFPEALHHLLLGLAAHQKLHDRNEIMRALLDIGKTYLALGNHAAALRYGREGLFLALQTKAIHFIRDGYHILASVYDRQHQTDSAYFYFRRYTDQKEQVLSDQTRGRFAAFNYEQKIALLNKEAQIKEARLEKEGYIKKVLIGGIFLLLLTGLFVFRNIALKRKNERQRLLHQLQVQQLESERTRAELQHQASELKMQALQAQMNPHFIFNCLNSINRFILENETEQASDYLTRFARLIRIVLQNSSQKLISLADELETLHLYIGLEQMRFSKHFHYSIQIGHELDPAALLLPPMLLQPFVENAIWHGLMHQPEKGELNIILSRKDDLLCCTITDNGVGFKNAPESAGKPAHKRSMALQIIASRLQLLSEAQNSPAHFEIKPLVTGSENTGTAVVVTIPVQWETCQEEAKPT